MVGSGRHCLVLTECWCYERIGLYWRCSLCAHKKVKITFEEMEKSFIDMTEMLAYISDNAYGIQPEHLEDVHQHINNMRAWLNDIDETLNIAEGLVLQGEHHEN